MRPRGKGAADAARVMLVQNVLEIPISGTTGARRPA